MPAHAQRGFVKLTAGASLRDFRIHGYGDGDEAGPIVRGNGSLLGNPHHFSSISLSHLRLTQTSSAGGTIVTGAGGGLELDGNVVAVDYRSANAITLTVNGNIQRSSFRQGALAQPMKVNVTGGLEIDDGTGGILVQQSALYSHGDVARWDCGEGVVVVAGLYLAEFAGDQMLVHCSLAGGQPAMSISSHHDAANITGNDGVGKLSVAASSSGTLGGQLMATMMGTGGYFTVRRIAV